jgi:hypothetical protein
LLNNVKAYSDESKEKKKDMVKSELNEFEMRIKKIDYELTHRTDLLNNVNIYSYELNKNKKYLEYELHDLETFFIF